MTGLNLETFLHLLRADFGAWATLGLIAGLLGLMAWTTWGSRRALRKCLALSLLAHFGLVLYGGSAPAVLLSLAQDDGDDADARIQSIKVTPTAEPADRPGEGPGGPGGLPRWDRGLGGLALADAKLDAPGDAAAPTTPALRSAPEAIAAEAATLETNPPMPTPPEDRPEPSPAEEGPVPPLAVVSPLPAEEIAAPVVAPRSIAEAPTGERLRADGPLPAPSPADRPRPTLGAPAVAFEGPSRSDLPNVEPRGAGPGDRIGDLSRLAPGEPEAVAETGVAAVDVIPARPDGSQLSVGGAQLRGQGRPPLDETNPSRGPAPRLAPTVALSAPVVEGTLGLESAASAERPTAGEGGPGDAPPLAQAEVGGTREGVEVARVVRNAIAPLPVVAAPAADVRSAARPDGPTAPRRRPGFDSGTLALSRVVPNGVPALPDIQGAVGGRPLVDVPEVYRSRLDPNRSALAYRAGASPASEQAVERALDWLARHQDADGRWDGATAKYDDGAAVKGDDDYTVHCPAGEPCVGSCAYWEADTALTGLALLAYLGSGYTQVDGKHAETVSRGLEFLKSSQKPDGDLRGPSRAVGMYCHAMATIALCEAYALTGDARLRGPVEQAIEFLAKARARDGQAWRYAPGAPVGDTSILGWVVMALKSAREIGIEVPSNLQTGTLTWLTRVSSGDARGLARYQPWDNVTPTMTAEAWACRQFLGVGGPGPASEEAAAHLLANGPKRGASNLYYWYYGTLAMYQHGGPAWARWNAEVRDAVVRLQQVRGHAAGSWGPDDSAYGAKGGRIYSTALATLTLEVYYRYLRLYQEPSIPPAVAPSRPRAIGRNVVPR